ncbi:hypothetical protein BJ875DRAFT_29250 [Amylocarpus encephaloides]|uniref:F-box domain-containing protein n=1 Tax=Amylocarpus encephaloides TaxID=45428 RepID=A0A9P7YI87_9HELO|nr:hypothetical protein BJ875DRAFT_29250 [Amylocarpus encephaloides]
MCYFCCKGAGHTWNPFIVSQNVLLSPTTQIQQSSKLLLLPSEILVMIFRFLRADPLNQICLAFTCKQLLETSQLLNLKRPTLFYPKICRCQLRDKRGRVKVTWIVCYDCLRFRPRKQSYWKKKQSYWSQEKKELYGWENLLRSWASGSLLQCPDCWLGERCGKTIPRSS